MHTVVFAGSVIRLSLSAFVWDFFFIIDEIGNAFLKIFAFVEVNWAVLVG